MVVDDDEADDVDGDKEYHSKIIRILMGTYFPAVPHLPSCH